MLRVQICQGCGPRAVGCEVIASMVYLDPPMVQCSSFLGMVCFLVKILIWISKKVPHRRA